jgi:hypothetical protein
VIQALRDEEFGCLSEDEESDGDGDILEQSDIGTETRHRTRQHLDETCSTPGMSIRCHQSQHEQG